MNKEFKELKSYIKKSKEEIKNIRRNKNSRIIAAVENEKLRIDEESNSRNLFLKLKRGVMSETWQKKHQEKRLEKAKKAEEKKIDLEIEKIRSKNAIITSELLKKYIKSRLPIIIVLCVILVGTIVSFSMIQEKNTEKRNLEILQSINNGKYTVDLLNGYKGSDKEYLKYYIEYKNIIISQESFNVEEIASFLKTFNISDEIISKDILSEVEDLNSVIDINSSLHDLKISSLDEVYNNDIKSIDSKIEKIPKDKRYLLNTTNLDYCKEIVSDVINETNVGKLVLEIDGIKEATADNLDLIDDIYKKYNSLKYEEKQKVFNGEEISELKLSSDKLREEILEKEKAEKEAVKKKASSASSSVSNRDTDLGTVYWTPNGECYHSTQSCRSLSRSRTIISGTNPGGRRPCSICY